MKYDIVVVGSGISGMRAAIEAKELGANVALITKSSPSANNSFMAKGGINAAFGNMGDEDNIFEHSKETLKSSVGLGNDESIKFSNKVKKFNGVDYYVIMKDIELVENARKLTKKIDVNEARNTIGYTLFKKLGIVRNGVTIKRALENFEEMEKNIKEDELEKATSIKNILELQNALLVSKAIALSALKREESRGSHFRIDYPETDKKFEKNTLIGIEEL
jgi:succinate dehydrogenase/fumarate reductase flavoprotein subunit